MALHRDLTYQNGIHGIVAFVFANTNDRDAYTPKTTDLHKVARVGEEYHLLTSLTPVTWETLGSGGTSGTGDIDASQVVSGILDIARIPAAALERVTVVTDQAARYGLTIDTVQLGDTVKQSDTGVMYRVIDVANLNNAAGYMEYTAGSAASVPWTGVTGKPTTLSGYGITDGYTDADAKAACVADTITDGVTDVAPSQNVVYDALDTKENADPAIQSHITQVTGNPHNVTLDELGLSSSGIAAADVTGHITDTTNPHSVTVTQIGAEPANANIQAHITNTENPHNVSVSQIGAVAANTAITGGTHAKITYDSKGLVTAGADLSAGDVPDLDAAKITSGIFDIARIPAAAIERMVPVADQTARFALTIDTVQLGDTVKQLDTGIMYVVIDVANLNNASGYAEYTAATAAAVPWSGVTDKPTTLAGYGITDGYTDADAQDACVAQTITDGVTTSAPSQDVIFDALAGKEDADPAIQSHITATGNPHSTTAVDVGAEPAFTKNTAFNKNFGSTAATVCEGDDARLSDARTPTTHTHVITEVTDIIVSDVDLSSLGVTSKIATSAPASPEDGDIWMV